MNTTKRLALAALLAVIAAPLLAIQLRVTGTVTAYGTHAPLEHAVVKVYKDGVRIDVFTTNDQGRYNVLLDNGAEYVLRFSRAGRVSKCYSVDTRGAIWEGDNRIMDLEVEMTLFEPAADLDLSWFDMPMGMARFNPMTGHVAWNAEYERRVRPEVDRLMAEIALRREPLAAVRADRTTGARP
jgi:hypothetical protein